VEGEPLLGLEANVLDAEPEAGQLKEIIGRLVAKSAHRPPLGIDHVHPVLDALKYPFTFTRFRLDAVEGKGSLHRHDLPDTPPLGR
jgi:hypothetical protein